MSVKDPVFRQFSQDMERSYLDIARGDAATVNIYVYAAKTGDTLFKLAAQCNLPYETVACLNGIAEASSEIAAGRDLYLPTAPGLFVKANPATSLDYMLSAKRFDGGSEVRYDIGGESFDFRQGERLSPTERAFFLDTALSSPLPQGIVTSVFGERTSPITGRRHVHGGVDLAAPVGTPVVAAKGGSVKKCGNDSIYGNYIVVSHGGGFETLYGHLSRIFAKEGASVLRGEKIGEVGSTGASTGPHLHFEVRSGGFPQNINKMFEKR